MTTRAFRSHVATALWRVLLRSRLGPDGPLGVVWWLPRLCWERGRATRPHDLQAFEWRRYSQNGEDGIIAEVLRRLEVRGGTAIEIGAADGTENCTRALLDEGWRAIWIESDTEKAATAAGVGADRVTVLAATVTAENVSGVLDAAGAPLEPGVLVIDIDGNDFDVLDAVLAERRPNLIVAEYNALSGPSWWVQPYDPSRAWDQTAWHGAGLRALTWLARRHGFALVGCDSSGVNAFFVRIERASQFDHGSARHHYMPPEVRLPFGHPWSRRVAPLPLESGAIKLWAPPRWPTRRRRTYVPVLVRNRGPADAHGFCASHAVSLASRWAASTAEPDRRRESFAVRSRGRTLVILRVDLPDDTVLPQLELFAVQEDVRWFGDPPGSPLATVKLNRRGGPPRNAATTQ